MECIVQVNFIGFANGLDVKYKWGVKDDFKIFVWTTGKMELLLAALEKTIGGVEFGQEENKKFSFWDTKQAVGYESGI